ncbi:MAG TPA: MBL fold metallo-hydrolase [Nitrososphaerales archaeon]|nr:MBL fold metallo-hydrolase [Nitrososphaerales archaeon]
MARVSLLGGVGEIGGNKILVEDKDARVMLDFGMSIAQRARFFSDPYVSPRRPESLLTLGIIPSIEGVYSWDTGERKLDAIFLSHAHLDHYGYLSMVHRDVPVHCGETTERLMAAITETKRASFETDYKGLVYKTFRSGASVKVGSITVRPVHVDHSIPGAYGLVVETSTGSFVYTGDLRAHGRASHLTHDFARVAAESDASLLLTEATNMVGGAVSSEEEVAQKLAGVTREAKGLVMTSFSGMDTDRLTSFHRAAEAADRKLAISMRQAYLISKLDGEPIDGLPRLGKGDVVIYRRNKKRYEKWEEQVSKKADVITSEDLTSSPKTYVVATSLSDMEGMVGVKPSPGSVYILSSSEPYNEEMELDMQRLIEWLDFYGMPLYHIHVSGHIMPQQLRSLVSGIGAKKVAPIHTEHPELFLKFALEKPEVGMLPVRNEWIEVR